jgi:hypothetical protein
MRPVLITERKGKTKSKLTNLIQVFLFVLPFSRASTSKSKFLLPNPVEDHPPPLEPPGRPPLHQQYTGASYTAMLGATGHARAQLAPKRRASMI